MDEGFYYITKLSTALCSYTLSGANITVKIHMRLSNLDNNKAPTITEGAFFIRFNFHKECRV